jgi:NAD(P)-dependent dehydrogenase (short-subunit alcohol dehydrogenase family)
MTPTTAIVTGAAHGIGRATALMLAAGGARLVLVDIDKDALDATCAEACEAGGRAEPVAADLADPTAAELVVGEAQRHLGGLDALVSNAGVLNNDSLVDLSVDEWDRVFAVNVRATWLLGRAAHPLLAASRGALVATGSIAGSHPAVPHGAYSPSKAALLMLIRQLAFEWGPDGIRVNSVSPGMVVTAMSAAFYADPERKRARDEALPLRRVGEPEDIARTIVWLLGSDARYITGQDILVDGGLDTMLMPAARIASTP